MPGGRPKSDTKQRFLAKVKKVESGCHEWQAGIGQKHGYGKFVDLGKTLLAHRASYSMFVGPIPDKAWVLHRCDNRKCVNPAHLFLGDSIINIADMDAKGRRGAPRKLNEKQVAEIRKMLSERYSQQVVAEKYDIDQTSISRIKLRQTYKEY